MKPSHPGSASAPRSLDKDPAAGSRAAPAGETAEALGWQLRAALPPLRLHSVSLYDREANVLWLSEGALGPDEHALVLEAIAALAAEPTRTCAELRPTEGRVAAFLGARSAGGELLGLIMVLSDSKAGTETFSDPNLKPELRATLQRIAAYLQAQHPAPPPQPAPPPLAAVPTLSAAGIGDLLERAPHAPAPTLRSITASAKTTRASAAQHSPPPAAASTKTPAAHAAAALIQPVEVEPYTRLRQGGRTRRFGVVPLRPPPAARPDPGALDLLAVKQLFGWLARHRNRWSGEAASFTLKLSLASIKDERFVLQIVTTLRALAIPPAMVGFEIAQTFCAAHLADLQRFLGACERAGCFVVLDGFSFDPAALALLRSQAVRMVRIDPKLTAAALQDKMAQATVVAIVQAAKILGVHCAAQRVDCSDTLEWLTAIGCDFAQGTALAAPQSLEACLD